MSLGEPGTPDAIEGMKARDLGEVMERPIASDDGFLVEVVPDLPQWLCYCGLLRVGNHDRRFRHRHRAALERLVYQERPLVLAVSEGTSTRSPFVKGSERMEYFREKLAASILSISLFAHGLLCQRLCFFTMDQSTS